MAAKSREREGGGGAREKPGHLASLPGLRKVLLAGRISNSGMSLFFVPQERFGRPPPIFPNPQLAAPKSSKAGSSGSGALETNHHNYFVRENNDCTNGSTAQ